MFKVGKEVVYGPEPKLDYELEVGCIIGEPTKLGETVSIESADDHIFGLVLINDWSGKWSLLNSVPAANNICSTRHPGTGDGTVGSNEREELRHFDESLDHHSGCPDTHHD